MRRRQLAWVAACDFGASCCVMLPSTGEIFGMGAVSDRQLHPFAAWIYALSRDLS